MKPLSTLAIAVSLTGLLTASWALAEGRQDLLIADFEAPTYGDWQVEGTAFGPGPARGSLPNQMGVSGFQGAGLVNSFYEGDKSTGRLLSPVLKIDRKYVNFLVGGGGHPGETCINLLLDGKVVRTATGPNDQFAGTERLEWHTWDVAELAGKSVRIEIVDRATGGWGHINVDQIVQSDMRKAVPLVEQRRALLLEKQYLNLPVKNGAPKRRVSLAVDAETIREFEMELAEAEPDFWVFLDISAFRGREGVLRVDRMPEGTKALEAVVQADTILGTENLYRERLRPQFHFTSRRGWNNDPNGLVFHEGEYHLYYQHNPYGWAWGNMHWGHAVSTDMVHWKELPIALYPRKFGDWAFSGSAAVDRHNTTGFGRGTEPPLVAAYTSTGRGECLVYSTDRGRTFQEFEGNPVFKHEGRDPKIFWYAPGKHWVIVLYSVRDQKNGLLFLTSKDLKQWEPQDWIEGYFECPELVELPVDGDPRNTRWALFGADGATAVGRFDGKKFTPEGEKHRTNWGNCFYAAQVYNDLPAADGRKIRVAWGQVNLPTMPFNQMMTFPVELSLQTTEEGLRLFANPVRELAKLHRKHHHLGAQALPPDQNPLASFQGDLWDLRLEFEPGTAEAVSLRVRGIQVLYNAKTDTLFCQGKTAPVKPVNGRVKLQLLVDRASLEIFANDGRTYMPMGVLPKDDDHSLQLYALGGTAKIHEVDLYELNSAWTP